MLLAGVPQKATAARPMTTTLYKTRQEPTTTFFYGSGRVEISVERKIMPFLVVGTAPVLPSSRPRFNDI
jgi:hypothetical protein